MIVRESIMRSLFIAAAATLAIVATPALFNVSAQAAPGGGLTATVDGLSLIEKTDFLFGGKKHCWYGEGWHGAGWYWCGYAKREGKGWGGPEGYNGWKH
jgi:hypothetical protein